jgi:hypothetical protein
MRNETPKLATRPSWRSERRAAAPEARSPARSRRFGDGHKFNRAVRRLKSIPPIAMAAITAFR